MNKRLKIAIILIAVILISALVISITYSKYFSKITGTGTATVARWSFKANGQTENLGPITLGNTASKNSKVADGKIAPGTDGKFDVIIDASGTEVDLEYEIKFANIVGDIPANLKFYEDEGFRTVIPDLTTKGYKGTITKDNTGTKKTVSFYWKWDYETTDTATNDPKDTASGKAAGNISFNITVTGTQAKNQA